MTQLMGALVRGYVWKGRMDNRALFRAWTPFKLKRKEAKELILKTANGSYDSVYENSDIESMWETLG